LPKTLNEEKRCRIKEITKRKWIYINPSNGVFAEGLTADLEAN